MCTFFKLLFLYCVINKYSRSSRPIWPDLEVRIIILTFRSIFTGRKQPHDLHDLRRDQGGFRPHRHRLHPWFPLLHGRVRLWWRVQPRARVRARAGGRRVEGPLAVLDRGLPRRGDGGIHAEVLRHEKELNKKQYFDLHPPTQINHQQKSTITNPHSHSLPPLFLSPLPNPFIPILPKGSHLYTILTLWFLVQLCPHASRYTRTFVYHVHFIKILFI
jgi:hypothetical protein